jgi:hypothetical protein
VDEDNDQNLDEEIRNDVGWSDLVPEVDARVESESASFVGDETSPLLTAIPRRGARTPDAVGTPQRSLLPVVPLAVLLPRNGRLSALESFRVQLEERLRDIQDMNPENDGEVRSSMTNEELMLSQALQWLNLSGRGDER